MVSENETRRPNRAGQRPWLSPFLWLGLLLFLVGAAWLLLSACGLTWLGGRPSLIYCVDARAQAAKRWTAILAERQQQEARRDELARLQREIAGLPPCPIVVHAEPPVQEPPPEEPLVLGPPPKKPPPPEEPPDLPEDRWREKDISLLDGCWSLVSDYLIRDIETGRTRPVTNWQVCFDESGQGRQTLDLSDGTRCTARVNAHFEGAEALRIDDLDNVPCSDGSFIYRRENTCSRISDDRAQCFSYPPKSGVRARVSFRL